MRFLKKIFLPAFLIVASSSFSQKMTLVSGNLKEFKDVSSFDIKFEYDSMTIGPSEIPEEEYLKTKSARWEEREPGKGKVFRKMWFESRERLYEPAFIKNFEEATLKKLGDKNAKYTLLLKTRNTEGGFDIGVHGKDGVLGGELLIVESSDNSKVKAKIHFYDARGTNSTGGDFNMDSRIKSAYDAAGKWLGIFFKRKSK
jgi:hypothetical protein